MSESDTADTELVWIARSSSSRLYHSDPDCHTLDKSDEIRQVSIRHTVNRELCRYCDPDADATTGSGGDCPYCGRQYGCQLATHIQHCPEAPR